eukprot:CAMPEP_0168347596 /NCGR_PEP_ID=MMETSP0213-20121227/19109_1 /TAXON_ID=151035 /ORGANISM="Euplotes harpa, Strain FSP1.4" /LENGTH=73 /DNA_ID=CAMNT_0008356765 /DNA_START=795 /DNA_END=1016 /DNA_ORIENTATION=+
MELGVPKRESVKGIAERLAKKGRRVLKIESVKRMEFDWLQRMRKVFEELEREQEPMEVIKDLNNNDRMKNMIL